MNEPRFALDRSSVRATDQDGRMHVSLANISKANVCPYYGREIPDYEALGLDAQKIYQLYRDPEELAKSVPTFNNLPILSKHVPHSASSHDGDITVGTTGSHAEFKSPFMTNSLAFWESNAIAGIDSGEQKELSSSYRYRADMTPGEVDGVKFDGVMRDIVGNHVALVKNGRAGPDVVVGDEKLKPNNSFCNRKDILMPQATKLSRKALLASGSLRTWLTPKLAADQKIDLGELLKDVTAKTWKNDKKKIKDALIVSSAGKLAKDASVDDVMEVLDQLDEVKDEIADVIAAQDPDASASAAPGNALDDDSDMTKRVMEFLSGKISDEDMANLKTMMKPEVDADKEAAKDKEIKNVAVDANKSVPVGITQAAMDAAITAAQKATSDATIARLNGIREAEKLVRPYVGEISVAMDSADEVLKFALTAMKVDIAGVPPAAFPFILKAQAVPGAAVARRAISAPAMDAAAAKASATRFPQAGRLK